MTPRTFPGAPAAVILTVALILTLGAAGASADRRSVASLPGLDQLASLPGGWRNAEGDQQLADVPGTKLVVSVRERSLISGSEITLGDVARITGSVGEKRAQAAGLALCAAPRPGQTAQITRTGVESTLLRGGIDLDMVFLDIPQSATAELETEFLRYDEMVRLVTEALYADMSAFDRDAILLSDWRLPVNAQVPSGDVEKRVEVTRNGRETGTIAFQILALQGGRVRSEIKGSVVVDVQVQVVKAAAAIPRGGLIQAGHLVVETARLSTISSRAVRELDWALGKAAARDLNPGDTVETAHLRTNLLVRRNDTVIMQVQTSTMRLQATGVSLGQGGVGDVIPVINPTSRKELMARIVGPQRVEVIF